MRTIPRFQPLEDVLLRGWPAPGQADPLVVRHAEVHRRVFEETSDGAVLSVLLRMYDGDVRRVGLTPAVHHELVRDQLATGRVAQEATAIYLAIKRHPPDEQPLLLSLLDSSFERYYEVLAEVLDEVCGASRLQRLVAWSAARLAFGSRFGLRLVAELADTSPEQGADQGLALTPEPSEQPDARLQRLLEVVSATDALDELLGQRHPHACARVGLPAWDLHDEHAWQRLEGHPPEVVELVEQELGQALRKWWVEAADLPVLTADEQRALRQDLATLGAALELPIAI